MIITGALLLAVSVAAVAGSVPLWKDGLDTDLGAMNQNFTWHDGYAVGGAVLLDLVGATTLTAGAVLLPMGLKQRRVEMPLSLRAEPNRGSVAGIEVGLAY